MKRLFRIGLSCFITSFMPILSWLMLGIILEANLSNVFSITYPLQFVSGLLFCLFGSGANVSEYKDKQKNGVLSEITLGSIVAISFAVGLSLLVDKYLDFMNVSIKIYRTFAIYSICSIFITLMFSLMLEKLYFEGRDKTATIHTIIFNTLNLVTLIFLAICTTNQALIVSVTLSVMVLYVAVLFINEYHKFKFHVDIWANIKYESQNIVTQLLLFVTYLFGFSSSFIYGEEYLVAINFVCLVTDSQWDACGAIETVAKIDIVNDTYNFKRTIKNSYLFSFTLVCSSIVLFFVLYKVYDVSALLGLSYLAFEICTMIMSTIWYFFDPYMQIELAPIKNTILTIIAEVIRMLLSVLIPLAYCTQIGQVVACLFMMVAYIIVIAKYLKVDKKGILVKTL